MHGDQYFFELPIYLEVEDNYDERFEQLLEAEAVKLWRRESDPRKDLAWHRQQGERWREAYLRAYGGRWRYNQIFGFLGIYPLGGQLRGDTWYSTKKLARRNIARKDIAWCGKAFEMDVRPEQSSAEIFEQLRKTIRCLRHGAPYKRRFLDIRSLELAGPFLDWRRLMDISVGRRPKGISVEELPELLAGRRVSPDRRSDR
jgi:hypothetical protein